MPILEPRAYSERLGVISPHQLQSALDRFGLGRLIGAEPAPGGLFGQNVFLTTTEGEFVLRGRSHEPKQFHEEAFWARLIHERTSAPAPWPYLIDDASDIFGWDYVIMPCMPGLQVGDLAVWSALADADKVQVAFALGEGLARLHELTRPQCGEYDHATRTIRSDPRPFRERALERMEYRYHRALTEASAVTPADIDWCRSVVEDGEAALDLPFEPTVVHHDYKQANSTALRTENGWLLGGVFDLQECYFGDPDEDLARPIFDYQRFRRLERYDLAAEFVAGYQSRFEMRSGYEERFRIYVLRDRLQIWAYEHRVGTWAGPDTTFSAWCEPFLDYSPFH